MPPWLENNQLLNTILDRRSIRNFSDREIPDDIFNAIQEISNEGSYAVIFDKSNGITLIYTNPKFDLSLTPQWLLIHYTFPVLSNFLRFGSSYKQQ